MKVDTRKSPNLTQQFQIQKSNPRHVAEGCFLPDQFCDHSVRFLGVDHKLFG
jgi:hypothetical protein